MVRVVQSKAPIDFEELDGSRTSSERGLFLVPSISTWEDKSYPGDGQGCNLYVRPLYSAFNCRTRGEPKALPEIAAPRHSPMRDRYEDGGSQVPLCRPGSS